MNDKEIYKKVTIMNSVLDLSGGEKYKKITIYSDFVNRNADYAIINYEKNGDEFEKKIPSSAIKYALEEFEKQKKKNIVYGKDVEVMNVNDIIEKAYIHKK